MESGFLILKVSKMLGNKTILVGKNIATRKILAFHRSKGPKSIEQTLAHVGFLRRHGLKKMNGKKTNTEYQYMKNNNNVMPYLM
jgi:hypothetical protein